MHLRLCLVEEEGVGEMNKLGRRESRKNGEDSSSLSFGKLGRR